MTRRLVGTESRLAFAFVRLAVAAVSTGFAGGCAVGGGDDNAPPIAPIDAGDARAPDASTGGDAAKASDATSSGASDAPKDAPGADSTVQDGSPGDTGAPNGDGGSAAVLISSTSAIDLGAVGCGAAAVTRTLTVGNSGTGPLVVSATTTGSGFSVSPTNVTVPAGGSTAVTVSVAVPTSAKAGAAVSGSLNLFTNDPRNANLAIALSATPTGATIALADQNGQPLSSVSFASARVSTPAIPVAFELINQGNAAAIVTVAAPSDKQFSLYGAPDGGVSVMLSAHSAWAATAEFTPAGTSPSMTTANITVNGVVCGTSPSSLTFSGAGTTGKITGWPGPLPGGAVPSGIDFGAANCGGSAPTPQAFTLVNSGPVGATVTGVSFVPAGGAGFTTNVQPGMSIAANGGTLPVSVTAPSVASPADVTKPVDVTLMVHTDADPSSAGQSVTLREHPTGAILAFDTKAATTGLPSTTSFGNYGAAVLLGPPQKQTFGVTNTGNAPAEVFLTATVNGAGAVIDAGAADATVAGSAPPPPFTVQLSPLMSVTPSQQPEATDSVTFSPVAAGGTSGSLAMRVPTPDLDAGAGTQTYLCAVLPAPIPLAGTGIGGGPSLSATSLSFSAQCGSATPPPAQVVTVTNNGTLDMNWWLTGDITGPGTAQYAVSTTGPNGMAAPNPGPTTPMLLAPRATATVSVSAKVLPSGVTGASALDAQLTVATDVPYDLPHVISIHEVPIGDQLVFSPTSLGFGSVPVSTTTLPLSFTVTNNANPGSASASFTLAVQGTGQSAYTPASWSTLSLASGASLTEAVAFSPTNASLYPGTIALLPANTDTQCTQVPSPIQLIGTGTAGQVSVSATTLTFGTDPSDGLVNCGATGSVRTFTVSNVGNQPFTIPAAPTFASTTTAAGTYFTAAVTSSAGVAVAFPDTVDFGDYVTVTVTPKPIPAVVANPNDPSPFSDTLTVTTDAAGDAPHAVNLVMQARGAVIANTPLTTTWSFGTIGFGSIGTFTSTITNTGNAPASVTFAGLADGGLPDSGLAQPTIFGLGNDPTTVVPNGVTSIVGQFAPPSANGAWSDQGILALAADARCEPFPTQWVNPMISLSGSSNGNPPVTLSGSFAFPTTDCGSAAPAGQSITLTNNTNQTYPLTLKLNLGKYYTARVGGSDMLPANGVALVTVTPITVAPGHGVLGGAASYADNLSITVGAPTLISFNVPVSWTLNGAVLSLPNGAGPYKADTMSGHTLAMSNSNAATATATVDFLIQPSGAVSLTPPPPVSVAPSVLASPVLTSASSAPACPTTTNSTLTFMYTGPVCQPFEPASVTVSSCVGTQ